MRLYLSVENGKADQFENDLLELDFSDFTRRERDFMTDFIFDKVTKEEEEELTSMERSFNNH